MFGGKTGYQFNDFLLSFVTETLGFNQLESLVERTRKNTIDESHDFGKGSVGFAEEDVVMSGKSFGGNDVDG